MIRVVVYRAFVAYRMYATYIYELIQGAICSLPGLPKTEIPVYHVAPERD
jgi:hypothetical protein